MTRADIAYVLMTLLIACVAAMAVYTHRFARYRRAVMRGHPDPKPVAKPFWLP